MKKILLLFGLFSFCFALNAQTSDVACVPDSTLADSVIVFPMPLDSTTGEGDIVIFPACINEEYELVFSLQLPGTFTFNNFEVPLIRAEIEATGAVKGLPEGLNYLCNPPDCVFPAGESGCIVVKGIPSSNNIPDTTKLVITASVTIDGLGTIIDSIPGNIVDGEYNFVLNNTGECTTVSTSDILASNITLANIPNPVIDQTTIEVSAEISGDFQFLVHDVAGKLMHQEKIQLTEGYNSFNYDASQLGVGMYIYSLSNELGAVAQKMIVGNR